MFLSRIKLNPRRRETMEALASPQLMHSAVDSSFQGGRQRNLWRIDWLNNACYLLILSPNDNADFSHITKKFGFPDSKDNWEIKNYDILLERLKPGQVWQFRLCANPVRSSFQDKDSRTERGKVFAHVTQDQQKQWLLTRAKSHGFLLDEDLFDVVHTQWLRFNKKGSGSHRVTLRTATFEGILTISDVQPFIDALKFGIGRAKAYGCGLLTIAPPAHLRGGGSG
ncbi:MAG TPA: type I-E CRISPR-associated protein Cas6/Cse3/CasE [Clostridiales bacterium]|jgi:CRISPR system Cascade subunit CasE|nr:type I-E CRISPR-associated protein Cas6/Cse3/CasE [Clostridiales bacterium]